MCQCARVVPVAVIVPVLLPVWNIYTGTIEGLLLLLSFRTAVPFWGQSPQISSSPQNGTAVLSGLRALSSFAQGCKRFSAIGFARTGRLPIPSKLFSEYSRSRVVRKHKCSNSAPRSLSRKLPFKNNRIPTRTQRPPRHVQAKNKYSAGTHVCGFFVLIIIYSIFSQNLRPSGKKNQYDLKNTGRAGCCMAFGRKNELM